VSGDLHDLVDGFRDAERYERGRTDYPSQVPALVASGLGLAPGARVLDLGAGTGMLSLPFLEAGFDVVAVEPLAEMRAALEAAVGPERVLDGTAEAIPLEDASVAAVVCGDAFHWFDRDRAPAEMHRVLAPGGGAGIVWRVPRPDRGAPWLGSVAGLMEEVRPPHVAFDEQDRGLAALTAHGGFTEPVRHEIPFERTTDAEGVAAYVASASFVALLPDERRERLLADVRAVLPDGPLRIPQVAETWLTRRR
jgi:SAM-dependent methyltransferase